MADMKIKYMTGDSSAIACSPTGLATNAVGVYLTGRASAAVNNTVMQDLDHLFACSVITGNTPTAGRSINIYAYTPYLVDLGNPIYGGGIAGTDSQMTFNSANVMNSVLRFVASITVDSTSLREYVTAPVSIASLYGGVLPKYWGVFIAHDCGSSINAGYFYYDRIQGQTV